ncbi:MAG: SBBP repeat-containing protein, partial [candidate division Zixibacteria bacterium]|nr:SBBP repeat-containing protein [candidate division Zixibacteria bacterium]
MFCKEALILTVLSLLVVSTLMATTNPNSSTTVQKMNQMPLAFTKNMGQWDDRVLFRANAGGATMWFTKEGVTYQFTRHVAGHSREGGNPGSVGRTFLSDPGQAGMPILPGDRYEKDSVEQLVLTAKFVSANPNPEVVAEGQMEYKCNYFLGNEPSKWHTDVPNYEAITLKDIYPGIDLKYSGDGNGQAAYEFVLAPGADLAQIKVEYEGAEETSIDAYGRLVLKTQWGDMVAAIKSPTNGILSGTASFSQLSEKTMGFEPNSANRQALGTQSVGLVYSTYLGGGSYDYGCGIAVDGNGNAYVTGSAGSGFPTLNPYQTDQGGQDVFVTKLSGSGNSLIYSTYLGGGNEDEGKGIAVDGSGNAYVTGQTYSSDFPTLNPFQTHQAGYDAFVTKLSSSGSSLIYSTYLGGEGDFEVGTGIAVDGSGNAYATGYTSSSNFPTLNPWQATFQGGWRDVFVTKLSGSGSLIYSTYLGGEGEDYGYGIAVDDGENAYVTGSTPSSNFPTLNPYQTYQGGNDAFVTKLSSTGDSLTYSTYLGGAGHEEGHGIAVDASGNAYVTGYTGSSNFPTLNPYQGTLQGSPDVFVTKLSSSGGSLIYSTYLGGAGWEGGQGIAVDGSGYAYVTGSAGSGFPTLNPYQMYRDTADVFVTKLSSSGNTLIYSTYLGGGGEDWFSGIAVDGSGNAYVTGRTASSDFPTQNPYQTDQGGSDAFVTKLSYFSGSDYVITPTPDTADVFYIKQADIDGDNYTDVIYTGNTSDSLYIAYGKDSTLDAPRNYLKVTKAALAVEFVNGDSLLDIVARTTGKVYVLLNLGNRNFSIDSQTVSPSYRSSVFPSIATGYFNNDAHLDAIISENTILYGNGTGSFSAPTTLPFSFDAVAASDFDGNGTDDIVVTAGDSAFIYLNDGSGNLSRSTALCIGYRTHDFTGVVAGMDLNSDGKTDFVTVTGNTTGTNDTSVVTIALGDGSGGVASSDTLRIVGTALNLALADVDKDHNLDISLVNATSRSLLIVNNDGAGNFAPPVSISLGSGTNPLYALVNADLDRNGAPDFVIGGQTGNSILLAINEIPSDPILPDEMVTTGYNNVTLRVENPRGLVISQSLRTVAGSAYWRKDADGNDTLDESAYDYNLQYGEYRIVIRPKSNVGSGPLCSVGIRIDGTAERTIFASYSSSARNLDSDSLVFYYQVEPVSSIYPANG